MIAAMVPQVKERVDVRTPRHAGAQSMTATMRREI